MSDTSNKSVRTNAEASYPRLRLFVAGEWVEKEERATSPVLDPSTGAVLGHLPHADDQDVERAIGASSATFDRWRATPSLDRSRLIRNAADNLRKRRQEWGTLIALELGKPLAQALAETDTACEIFEWAAEEGRRTYGREIPARSAVMRMTAVQHPIGPVAAIAGWNAPAITPSRKVANALAAGCPIVLKPSENTPASALLIAHVLQEVGLPAGVLSVIFGDPVSIGRRFATDPRIRMITFTGATAIGKSIAALCAGTLKRTVLELGGHAPVIILDDVDPVPLAIAAVSAKFHNAGQICTSPTRFIVQNTVYEAFLTKFSEATRQIKVGDPFDPASQMGPLQNTRRLTAIRELAEDAVKAGAHQICGTAPSGPGFWNPPMVFSDIPREARVWHEEPFGPLALIGRCTNLDEAIAEANRLPAGLSAYAFTNNLRAAERLGREIEAGTLAINHWVASYAETPFGGVKDSGLGLEGGIEGLAAFLQTRFVSVASPGRVGP